MLYFDQNFTVPTQNEIWSCTRFWLVVIMGFFFFFFFPGSIGSRPLDECFICDNPVCFISSSGNCIIFPLASPKLPLTKALYPIGHDYWYNNNMVKHNVSISILFLWIIYTVILLKPLWLIPCTLILFKWFHTRYIWLVYLDNVYSLLTCRSLVTSIWQSVYNGSYVGYWRNLSAWELLETTP